MKNTGTSTMEDWERRSLTAFRAVAREVRDSSIVKDGLTIKHWLVPTADDAVKLEVNLLPKEPFRSLCISVRKVYMDREPSHLFKVHNIVKRYDTGEYRQRAAKVRRDYELILRGHDLEFHMGGKVIRHEQFFDTWLNDYTFHGDAIAKPDQHTEAYEGIRALGLAPVVESIVQKVALQLAGCVLELDDVIADWFNEERLPRIEPLTQASSNDKP